LNATVAAFLKEVREHPKFLAAAAKDPEFVEHLDAIESALRHVYEQGGQPDRKCSEGEDLVGKPTVEIYCTGGGSAAISSGSGACSSFALPVSEARLVFSRA
jgi:hypothetical protein